MQGVGKRPVSAVEEARAMIEEGMIGGWRTDGLGAFILETAATDRPGGRPSWAHDLRHTRLDALDLGKGRKSCSARAWLGLDAGALGTGICNRGSRSHSRLGT